MAARLASLGPMVSTTVAIIAVAGYAFMSGIAPLLQKSGADREIRHTALDWSLLIRLAKNRPYMFGTALQAVGWILGLIALRVLPVFLVQSILAGSIVITAFAEKIFMRQIFNRFIYVSMLVILGGLVLLSLIAEPGRLPAQNHSLIFGIELAPIAILLLGIAAVLIKNRLSPVALAVLSGAAFGGTALVGRIIHYPTPFWEVIVNPLLWTLLGYGIIGQYLMTVALQRASGTMTNALMILTGTLGPTLVSLFLFNEVQAQKSEIFVIVGSVLIVCGSILIARCSPLVPKPVGMPSRPAPHTDNNKD